MRLCRGIFVYRGMVWCIQILKQKNMKHVLYSIAVWIGMYTPVTAQGLINHGSVMVTTGNSVIVVSGSTLTTALDTGRIAVATPGLRMYVTGDWINHTQSQVFLYDLLPNSCWVYLIGGDQVLGGTMPLHFNNLVIGDSAGTKTLYQTVHVDDTVRMGNGYGTIELHGCTLAIDSGGMLAHEHANSYVYEQSSDTSGGVIITSQNIPAAGAYMIGGLGMRIETEDSLGVTTVVRGHVPQLLYPGYYGISRWYEIIPQHPSPDSTVFTISYFDHELGLHDASLLVPYWSPYAVGWSPHIGMYDSVHHALVTTVQHQYQFWTLGMVMLDPLPITMGSCTVVCCDHTLDRCITWATHTEHMTSHFVILRSQTLVNWDTVAVVTATGMSNSLQSYTYRDTPPTRESYYYRLGVVDIDGSAVIHNETTVYSACFDESTDITLYPNPNRGVFSVSIPSLYLPTTLRVYDIYGRCVFTQAVHTHLNTVQIAVSPGTYVVVVGDAARMMVVY